MSARCGISAEDKLYVRQWMHNLHSSQPEFAMVEGQV